ncbi:MAG: 50S ribosomal protein L15 [Alphaproteobacteria bacterium]|nr:50S ribosomal protein L15 [Alphaproteobacteria bacterium]
MKLNELSALKSSKSVKRVGRGIGSGKGKTCGRGHKGQKSRSGVSLLGFIGGPLQIWRTIPKRGFKNKRFASFCSEMNLAELEMLVSAKKIKDTVSVELLQKLDLLKSGALLRILGQGKLKTALTVEAHHFSKSAEEAIKKAGGEVVVLPKPVRGPKIGKTAKIRAS